MTDLARVLPLLLAVPSDLGALAAALDQHIEDGDVAMNDFGAFTAKRLPAGDVLGLTARYAWDLHHEQQPASAAELRGKRLLDFEVRLARGRSLVEAVLRERFGAPRPIAQHRVYGPWLVDVADGEPCALAYHATLPDWAAPLPDPAARDQFLIDLANLVASAESQEAVRRTMSAPSPAAGVIMDPRLLAFELVPPMPALDLARVLAWPNAIGESTDVHQASWRIKLVRNEGAYGAVTVPPIYGRFDVLAQLRARPTGGEVPGHAGGPVGRQQLGPGDLVWRMQIGP
jgi:hypothetical protein